MKGAALLEPGTCHGRLRFEARPRPGTSPWEWWWSTFAALNVPIYVGALPGFEHGNTVWTDGGPYVVLHHKLSSPQRRVTIAHEMHHLAIGGVCRPRCEKNEAKVRRATSRWLLPDAEDLAGRLRQAAIGRVARDLQVTRSLIFDRLEYLTPREQRIVDKILGRGPDWLADARAAQPAITSAA